MTPALGNLSGTLPRLVQPVGRLSPRWQALIIFVTQVVIFIPDHWMLPLQFQGVILHAIPIMMAARLPTAEQLTATESSRHALNGIARGLERLDLLVQDLLDLAQQRSEGLLVQPESVAIAGVIRRVLDSTDVSHWRRIAVQVPPRLP